MIEHYVKPDMSLWKGRVDDEDDFDSFRWHQWVKPLDLNNDNKKYDGNLGFGILGFESDQGIEKNKGRFGAAAGPMAIRSELAKLPCQFSSDVDIYDCGNVTSKYTDLESAQLALSVAVEEVLKLNLFPILIGGGHEIAFGHYMGISNFLENSDKNKLGIVNFDAHFDLRPYKTLGGTSGTMFRQIADFTQEKNRDYSYFVMGIQKHSNTTSLFKIAKELGVEYELAKDMINRDKSYTAEKLEDFISRQDHLYITICSDVFSTAYAPGVSAPQPLGLDPEMVIVFLKQVIRSGKAISFDIAEVSPRFDHDNITANLASTLIYTYVSSIAQLKDKWDFGKIYHDIDF